jgi:hypothetical protein
LIVHHNLNLIDGDRTLRRRGTRYRVSKILYRNPPTSRCSTRISPSVSRTPKGLEFLRAASRLGSGRQSRSGLAANDLVIPKHLFEPYKGANSREAPANLKPVGTGPYIFVDFEPGDLVKGERNPAYHVPDRPYFDRSKGWSFLLYPAPRSRQFPRSSERR